MDEELANTVMARFCEVNFSRVGNLSGFLMGIIRRVQQDGDGYSTRDLSEMAYPVRHRILDLIDAVRSLFCPSKRPHWCNRGFCVKEKLIGA